MHKKEVIIKVDADSTYEVGRMVHEQLVGNPDYIDSNIILNIDTSGEVHLYVTEEAKPFEIKLKF